MTDLTVPAVIELNDKSHRQEKRQERDRFLEGVCQAAGVPLIMFDAKAGYNLQAVQHKLEDELGLKGREGRLGQEVESLAAGPAKELVEPTQDPEAPVCPLCETPMAIRKVKMGGASKEVWLCGGYPECRKALPVNAA